MGVIGWQDSSGKLHDGVPSDRDLNRGDVESLRASIKTPDGERFTTILGPFPDALDADSLDAWTQDWYEANYGGGNPAYGSPQSAPPGPGAGSGSIGTGGLSDLGLDEFED